MLRPTKLLLPTEEAPFAAEERLFPLCWQISVRAYFPTCPCTHNIPPVNSPRQRFCEFYPQSVEFSYSCLVRRKKLQEIKQKHKMD